MKNKRWIALGITLLLSLSVIGCGSPTAADNTQAVSTQEASDSSGADAENETLIVCFSAANTKDADAVTSATPLIDGVSSVEWTANVIQETTGGEMVKIIPEEEYPLSYNDLADAAKEEADDGIRPAFESLGVDPSAYKTVFVGYPIWWYRMPMVMETFFDTYDFSGVTIIPFNTHEGSGDGGTYNMIREREPNAVVPDGLPIRGGNAGESSTENEIREWLAGLDLINQ